MSERKKIAFMVVVPDDIPESDISTIFHRLQQNFKDYDWVLRSENFQVEEQ